MRSYQHKVRKLPDHRLLNALRYRDIHPFPQEYVEACWEELRRRGYTPQEITQAIAHDIDPDSDLPIGNRLELTLQRQKLRQKRRTTFVFLLVFSVLTMYGSQTAAAFTSPAAMATLIILLILLRLQFRLNKVERILQAKSDVQ